MDRVHVPSVRLDTPIQYVKGVGPARAALFAAAGFQTLGDLLDYFPVRYESRSGEIPIADLRPGIIATVRGEVIAARMRPHMRTVQIHDGEDEVTLRWFNDPPRSEKLSRGSLITATGQVREYNGELELVQPIVSYATGALADQHGAPGRPAGQGAAPRLVGVYRAKEKLSSAAIGRVIERVFETAEPIFSDAVPAPLLTARKLPTRGQAITAMHRPASHDQLDEARRRLAYEELFLMELAMALRRRSRVALLRGDILPVTPEIDRRIRARFPFTLTPGQDTVIREIVRDMAGGTPMTRLLQGDVGSGKTVVALYAALVAVANRAQAAIMAPTEILARQHFLNCEKYLAGSRVRRLLLSGGASKSERTANLAKIDRGEVDLVVGTQALIQEDVSFARLGLVVVDEQHKFGVLQRHEFRTKGKSPHYLVMTATPIPRTLAMTVFGDLDVSVIRQKPPGRGRIITKVTPLLKWPIVMKYVRERLEQGEQAYVVCPLIGKEAEPGANDDLSPDPAASAPPIVPRRATSRDEQMAESDKPALTSVRTAYEKLMSGPWHGLPVAMLHGGMKSAEKADIIRRFAAGEVRALVSTTVVEVGVDVPGATIIIVEHAERFGLSQLHQLRGRVGRGERDSLCVLIAHSSSGKSIERLGVMAQTTNGFKIAEADLKLRGPGVLFGTRQHGLPDFRFANIVDDFALLEEAREDAFKLVEADPMLRHADHVALVPLLRKTYGESLALIDAG